jgi:2-dehydro-3-deoxyphosphogluconate aldolase / (4S)-4-hydroxy-2-oxoglutarate aldolase
MAVSKRDVIIKIGASGLVPVLYHPDMDVLLRVVSISYRCGLRVFEFMHQRDNKGLRFFEHLAEKQEEFPELTFGVGTVLDATMTERYIKAGAQFIASPFLRPDMGEVCNQHNKLWMPGCTTLEEIERSKALGAQAINVLPGNVLGFEFITPIAKQHPELYLIPSGIADLRENILEKWFEAGVWAIKLGAQVFTKERIAAKDWSGIENHLIELLKNIKNVQSRVKPVNLDSVPE